MASYNQKTIAGSLLLALALVCGTANAAVNVQCPGDNDGDAAWNTLGGNPAKRDVPPGTGGTPDNVVCKHLTAGDSFVTMSDGNPMYTFGFDDQTGTPPKQVIGRGILNAEWPGPRIALDQGDEFYLSLTNVGTVIRPDLFDPHTVHFHGFPNAASVFDGVPEVSVSINMGATLSYYYNIVEPGTYIYHCHVEATEHMEMGMLANLWVRPAQNRLADGTLLGNHVHSNPDNPSGTATRLQDSPLVGDKYVYNDGDGTTLYDVEQALQLSGFDSDFHDASLFVQPLPFAFLESDYPMINGRGYPETVMGFKPPPVDDADGKVTGVPGEQLTTDPTQTMDSAVTVQSGQKLLLRLSNVSIDRFYTLTAQGLTMKIVGTGAKQMRGTEGLNIYTETASVNFGGGETHDVIIDTQGVAPGTYFVYAAEAHQLSNKTQMDGGLMTEIVVTAAP
ncbi:MAG: multicopper oxidase domain-containing protein [Gammaproteobacteria bacterium]|nr:multicopper oxidase domain-containing protein [Gammaproteobacteria bacterium]MDH4253916.1 multicopper oxidase domain-containing protein [Gammaproteobacteria bacterium]MDH5310696.1 multicopper oxidase domain-containing protein [Gammaproteobacteria bacterium]